MMEKVVFVGPLPPPVNGFSNINASMLARLSQVAKVMVFDRSPDLRIAIKALRTVDAVFTTIMQVFRFTSLVLRMQVNAVYVGFSGGLGQLLDLPFIVIARLAGIPIYLHHHSFAYINSPNLVTRICLTLSGDARQIVLCSSMGEQLAKRYGLLASNITPVSNSGFMPLFTSESVDKVMATSGQALRVGFLGNITAEKGIFRYFAAVREALLEGLSIEAVVAGPVDSTIRAEFMEKLASVPGVKYIGAVYGPEKARFYESIDLLLFPSEYVNEAEPVTIWEALAAGVEVVATRRGCIPDVIAPGCGDCAAACDFREKAISAMKRQLYMSQAARNTQRSDIRTVFSTSQRQSRDHLTRLVLHIAGNHAALLD